MSSPQAHLAHDINASEALWLEIYKAGNYAEHGKTGFEVNPIIQSAIEQAIVQNHRASVSRRSERLENQRMYMRYWEGEFKSKSTYKKTDPKLNQKIMKHVIQRLKAEGKLSKGAKIFPA
jgi:hypothetical protein